MEFEQSDLDICEWVWDEGQQLLRNAPNLGDLEPGPDYTVDIIGVPFVQGGGRASYALVWNINEGEEPILVETRDFFDSGELFPIWANARIVPKDNRFYQPVLSILLALVG